MEFDFSQVGAEVPKDPALDPALNEDEYHRTSAIASRAYGHIGEIHRYVDGRPLTPDQQAVVDDRIEAIHREAFSLGVEIEG